MKELAKHAPNSSAYPLLEPLRAPVFRALWIATIASNLGTSMQDVGQSWLMVLLTKSPIIVALVATAGSLPVVLLALPAGALADLIDRRTSGNGKQDTPCDDQQITADPGHFVEMFLVESWAEHLRQHTRITEADRKIEERALAFHLDQGLPPTTHLIAESMS